MKEIKASGIAVMIFPEGTEWGNEKAKIVVGIAGVDYFPFIHNIFYNLSSISRNKSSYNTTAANFMNCLLYLY